MPRKLLKKGDKIYSISGWPESSVEVMTVVEDETWNRPVRYSVEKTEENDFVSVTAEEAIERHRRYLQSMVKNAEETVELRKKDLARFEAKFPKKEA